MAYCPNCSAYLGEKGYPALCLKCHYDIRAYFKEQARYKAHTDQKYDPETLYGQAVDQAGGEIETGKICPLCNNRLLPLRNNEFVFNLLGKNIPVGGVKYGSMKIMKRVVTEIRVSFDGWVCQNEHGFFTTLHETQRFLCPVCKEHTVPFGSMIRTCRRCNYHFQNNDFVLLHGRQLLEEEGWMYVPELEGD